MVVHKAALDMKVNVDDSEFVAVTAGIASQMAKLQREVASVANVLGEIGKTKAAITTLAALTKEAANTAGALAEIDKQLLAITKSKDKAQRAFESIKRMVEYKPPPGAGSTFQRPPGTMPDYMRPPAGGKRMAGIPPGLLPAIAAAFSPSVIGAVLNRYDPLLKEAADRYFFENVDPRFNEYLLGTTPGFLYGTTRAGMDRVRHPEGLPPIEKRTSAYYTPSAEEERRRRWRDSTDWERPRRRNDLYYESAPYKRMMDGIDAGTEDPWAKHEFWAQKRYKRFRRPPYGAGRPEGVMRREDDPYAPDQRGRSYPPPPSYEFALGGRTGTKSFGATEKADTERLEELERVQTESLERLEEEKEKNHEKELKRIEEMAESYASYVDPAPYIVEGLKSGEMRQAIEDFAIALGTRVAEELVHKLIVMGIMAILSMITGGGAAPLQMAMGRGGVIKAGRGILGTLPAKPGGHFFPWGPNLINAAEAGADEVLGVFPKGQRGRELILDRLLPMYNIPVLDRRVFVNATSAAPEVNVETRPVFNATIRVDHADRHGITVHNKASAGKVNKAITVRK